MTKRKYSQEDITDSPEDQEKLKPDQDSLRFPLSREDQDSTRFRDDEQDSTGIEKRTDITSGSVGTASDVSSLEKKLLDESSDPTYDTDPPLDSFSLDETDSEGEPLEEAGQSKDLFGKDLDDELVREEDEESE